MSLRDRLRAIDSTPKKAAPAPAKQFTSCYHQCETRPLCDFHEPFALSRDTMMLIQQDQLPDPLDPTRILYLDTETTGFAGGAGTVAFLVGLGYLTADGFVIHQYLMRDYPEEPFLLEQVTEMLNRFDVICTFNGRSFDVPLLRDRFIMQRMDTSVLDKPHIDLLHMSRRLWKLRLQRCNLSHLEEAILGFPRENDLPGSEVPQRYFDYLKTSEFALLYDVLTHNAQDIASLCTLLNHIAYLYEHPEEVPFAQDLFSMGASLEKNRHHAEARRCWRLVSAGSMHAPSQLRLAGSLRRCGDRQQAAEVWEGMIRRHEGGIRPYVELAKYCEHTLRDIPLALLYTQKAILLLAEPTLLDSDTVQSARNELQYRYDRLKKKALKS